jgi:hypothetical protein
MYRLIPAILLSAAIGYMAGSVSTPASATGDVGACIFRHIERLQNVHGTSDSSPFKWLLTQCTYDPSMRY